MDLHSDSVVAVIGASLAGLRAAETLRADGFAGRLVWIGEEAHLPYDRPPLSKQYLSGTWDFDRVQLRSPEKIDALNLDLRLGRRADSLDVSSRTVALDDGEVVAFDGLVIATGAHALNLPGAAGEGTYTVRTLEDCRRLAAKVGDGHPRGRSWGRIHRLRGGGDVPRARSRGHRGRGARYPARACPRG